MAATTVYCNIERSGKVGTLIIRVKMALPPPPKPFAMTARAPSPLTALSPLDGRYAPAVEALREWFSEMALIRHRLEIEIRWFEALTDEPGLPLPPLADEERRTLDAVLTAFDEAAASRVKEIEAEINHDVKAIEYYLKEQLAGHGALGAASEWIHFALTSEDVNNLAYALMLGRAREQVLLPALVAISERLAQLARDNAEQPMLARTHGQPASPTTLGKEIAVFYWRLKHQRQEWARLPLYGKCNGAVGNFNAHHVAFPDLDWLACSERFVSGLGLTWQPLTTQIEAHDFIAEQAHALIRINTILLDLSRDLWQYISLGYFRQRLAPGEVGSSTMPHKVNPIDFENAEGNLGVANALLAHLAEKLPVSRLQRDLSDSTVLRVIGTALGHSLLAWRALSRGLDKLQADPEKMAADLDAAWAVLGEAVQTLMRVHGLPRPYERLKELTRGKAVTKETLGELVAALELPDEAKKRLAALTPAAYTGLAATLVRRFLDGD